MANIIFFHALKYRDNITLKNGKQILCDSTNGNQDPYIWGEHFIHSYCKMNQFSNKNVRKGDTIYYISAKTNKKGDIEKCCIDTVLYVKEIIYWDDNNNALTTEALKKYTKDKNTLKEHFKFVIEHLKIQKERKPSKRMSIIGNCNSFVPIQSKQHTNITKEVENFCNEVEKICNKVKDTSSKEKKHLSKIICPNNYAIFFEETQDPKTKPAFKKLIADIEKKLKDINEDRYTTSLLRKNRKHASKEDNNPIVSYSNFYNKKQIEKLLDHDQSMDIYFIKSEHYKRTYYIIKQENLFNKTFDFLKTKLEKELKSDTKIDKVHIIV